MQEPHPCPHQPGSDLELPLAAGGSDFSAFSSGDSLLQGSLGSEQEASIVFAWQRAVSFPVMTSRTVFQYFNEATVTLCIKSLVLKDGSVCSQNYLRIDKQDKVCRETHCLLAGFPESLGFFIYNKLVDLIAHPPSPCLC